MIQSHPDTRKIPLAEIITIGDELLIGQVVDTNSAWMGEHLNSIGILVKQISSVSDFEQHILDALKEAAARADIILITGGLGPTKDDITKKTLCKYFKTGSKFDETSYQNIERLFRNRGKEVSALNRLQAEVPANCEAILNKLGTAPAMWFENDHKIYISMPGVPYEMKGIMESEVLPRLKNRFKLAPVVHKTILTQGIGESFLSELIAEWEDHLPGHMKLAYLPTPGMVRLRITATGADEKFIRAEVEEEAGKLESIAGQYIYGYNSDTLEEIVGRLLRERKQTLSTAESCTGGSIAQRITSVPGSSDYYIGSVVAYDNRIKETFLKIDPEWIKTHGAVSEPVVRRMAEQVRILFKTDYALATTGIAGPSGATPGKPVGTVWIALASASGVVSKKLQAGDERKRVILETAQSCLNLLRKSILGLE